ncbi:Uracil-DNA glycosylase, family 4 [Methanosarcina horonobensis HB-1 = JCM 15518]|uniref:Type-4 uracil-DNA glycosylase n=1 Tax=Methanosarcina horonobensis HB-1 = JCM 15518 TaxID=1434110 RepID=A0A0E3WU66_9EURY|nr:uracil-DNA glycosylase [Methanosarcina horonobensis]AKB77440.1 Uracil-DNA glycosylase, family 4 [Methanosarcina horonobensis HB-1 = JCM 15518]
MAAEEEDCGNLEERVRKMVDAGYETVAREAVACIRCPLHKSAIKRVIGKGSCNPKVFFIGEAPGDAENKSGIPFYGRAGKQLDKMVEYMRLSEEDWFVTNTVKCHPPENRKPKVHEIECCKPFLTAQIALLNPKLIILLGNTAERSYCPKRKLEWGVPVELDGRIVLKLYHPAALIYTASKIEVQRAFIDKNRELWQ